MRWTTRSGAATAILPPWCLVGVRGRADEFIVASLANFIAIFGELHTIFPVCEFACTRSLLREEKIALPSAKLAMSLDRYHLKVSRLSLRDPQSHFGPWGWLTSHTRCSMMRAVLKFIVVQSK